MKGAKSEHCYLSADQPDKIGRRIVDWRGGRGPNEAELTQVKLAEMCNISRSIMGKLERGETNLGADVAFAIAQVFGGTVEELCSGCRPKEVKQRVELGLSGSAQRYLQSRVTAHPEYIDVLNTLLSDETLADSLFRTILIYLNAQMTKIVPLVERDELEFAYIGAKTQRDMVASLVTQRLSKLLAVTYEKWEYEMLPETAKKIQKIRKKGKASPEAISRSGWKAAEAETIQKYGKFDVETEIKAVDAELKKLERQANGAERYAVLKRLLEEADTENA